MTFCDFILLYLFTTICMLILFVAIIKTKTKKKSVAANAAGAKYSTSQMCFGNAGYVNNFPLLKNGKNGPSSRGILQ